MKQIPTQTDGLTSLAAADFNQIPLETQTIITSSGQVLDGNFTNQASRAIIDLGMNAGFYTDSGTANNIVLSNSNNPAPTSLRDGIEVVFKAANTNTGATTLNLSGLGAKSVTNASAQSLNASYIKQNIFYKAIYVSSSDTFVISPYHEQRDQNIDSGIDKVGHITLGGGLLLNWGIKTVTPSGTTVTYSKAFTTGVFALTSTHFGTDTSVNFVANINSLSSFIGYSSFSPNASMMFIALGI